MPRRYDETMRAFKKHKLHRINATAAPAAMKGSARAGSVIAAPVKAEQRILKVCASVSDKKNCAFPSGRCFHRTIEPLETDR